MRRLATLLNIKPGEGRLALLVGLLFLCIQAGQGMGDNAASALFFLRFGVDFLPYMYLTLGVAAFVLIMAYSAGLGRFHRGRFFQSLMAGMIAALIVMRLALIKPGAWLYPVLWLTINCIAMILGTFVWNMAGDVSDARQAKRLFPLFTSAGILGSVLGNSITGLIAKRLGTEDLLLFYAALLLLALLLTRAIARGYFRPATVSEKGSSFWTDLRAGYDFVRGSTLLKLVMTSSVLFSILFFAIAFPFNKVVTASFPDEASVAGYLGLFSGITTAVTFLVSLLLANRIYARLGIVNSVLLMPLTYLVGFIVFASSYTLNGAVIARFSQMVVLQAIASAAWSALYNVVPSQKRGQVIAFENGVPAQAGVALSGVLLILGQRVLSTTQIFLTGIVLTIACGYLVWRMRLAYGHALIDALRAGRLEVFTTSDAGYTGLQGDAEALHVVRWALTDPKPATRRLAAQILGRMGNPAAAPALIAQAQDPDAGVRSAVMSALGCLHAGSAVEAFLPGLGDPDEDVRAEALAGLAQVEPAHAPEVSSRLEKLLNDPSPRTRMGAVVALARMGQIDLARSSLNEALAERDVRVRLAALDAFASIAPDLNGNADAAPVMKLLADTVTDVRAAACRALASLSDTSSAQALAARLYDGDASVRRAAADSLRKRGPEAVDSVLSVLDAEYEAARDAALDALPPGSVGTSERLRRFARSEIDRLRSIRGDEASLPPGGRATPLLCESLRHEAQVGEKRLVEIVGLIGNARAMDLVQKSMHGSDSEVRAAALEALETLGDKALARDIIAFLEEEPKRSEPAAVLASLLQDGDRWDRALAIRSAFELGLKDFLPRITDLRLDSDPLIAESAADALIRFNQEQPMNTLQTVSTLERVLLLRDVPIFSDLSPGDLQKVAEIAREQWFPKDTAIARQDEPGDMLFVIVEGNLQVVRTTGGKEQVLAQRGPGDFVGEMAIIESAPRSATLLTLGEVRVLAIDGETFKGILRERPDVSLAVMRSLSRRIRDMLESGK